MKKYSKISLILVALCLCSLVGCGGSNQRKAEDTVGLMVAPAVGTVSIEIVGANAHIGPRDGFSILRNGFSILRVLCKPRIISVVRNLLGGIFREGAEDTVGTPFPGCPILLAVLCKLRNFRAAWGCWVSTLRGDR